MGLPWTKRSLELQSSESSTFKKALSRDIIMKQRAYSVRDVLHTMERAGEMNDLHRPPWNYATGSLCHLSMYCPSAQVLEKGRRNVKLDS